MAVRSKVFQGGRAPLTAVSLYYDRLIAFFDRIAEYNEIRPLNNALQSGKYMPPAVQDVYYNTFEGKIDKVKEAYDKADADIETEWEKVIESMKELGLAIREQDIREFRSMARATNEESQFRASMREHVASLKRKCEKEIYWRKAYFDEMGKRATGESKSKKRLRKPKPLYVETPRKLLTWYEGRPERVKKRRAAIQKSKK